MARVVYSKPGVIADDVIRAEVRAAAGRASPSSSSPTTRRSVATSPSAGANWITSDALLALR